MEEVQRQISIEIQSNNQDAMTLYTRAKLAEKQRNYEQAIEDFRKVLELDPSFFNAAYSKASCENIIGRYDDAIATYNLAFTKDIDAPGTQTYNSRISSMRSSPHRMSRKPSKLFGGSQSPFRIRQFDTQDGFTQATAVAEAISRQNSLGGVPSCACKTKGQIPISVRGHSNILEEDSEHSERSPLHISPSPIRKEASRLGGGDSNRISLLQIEIDQSAVSDNDREETPQWENTNLRSCERIIEKASSAATKGFSALSPPSGTDTKKL